jgi:type IV secretion system protein VirB6
MGIGAGVFGASRMARGALGMGRNAGIGAWKGISRQKGGLVSLRECPVSWVI